MASVVHYLPYVLFVGVFGGLCVVAWRSEKKREQQYKNSPARELEKQRKDW